MENVISVNIKSFSYGENENLKILNLISKMESLLY